ncbi:MAG: protoporphyrinogen oxidase [Gemmatimonadota bacterium]
MTRPVVTGTLIVGGGITGLAAAERLAAAGAPFLLLEAASRLGGKIATESVDGLVIEGGPDCFLAAKPAGMALVRALGLEARLRGTDPGHRRTYVRRNGRLHELPEGLTGLVPSRIAPLLKTRVLSPLGRVRAGCELLLPGRASTGDESIARFVTRRFGAEAYDWLVEPLLSGIYAGDGAALSLAATFPQLATLEREQGSILRAMLRRPVTGNPGAGSAPTGFVTPAGGLGELADALMARLPLGAVRCGVAVTEIARKDFAYRVTLADGTSVVARRLLLAIPAYVSAQLLATLDPALAGELAAIPFVSTATVSLAFPAAAVPRPLDGYGYVSPRAEGGPIVACTWTSNKFPDRVPKGMVLVRFFIGRAGEEAIVDAPDERLVSLARSELAQLSGVTAAPALARVFRWPRSIPQYVVGHLERLERISGLAAAHPGLLLAGASYRGVGIPDCIASGWAAAQAALDTMGAAA